MNPGGWSMKPAGKSGNLKPDFSEPNNQVELKRFSKVKVKFNQTSLIQVQEVEITPGARDF